MLHSGKRLFTVGNSVKHARTFLDEIDLGKRQDGNSWFLDTVDVTSKKLELQNF